jgi:hypothetical protein
MKDGVIVVGTRRPHQRCDPALTHTHFIYIRITAIDGLSCEASSLGRLLVRVLAVVRWVFPTSVVFSHGC